MPTEQQNGNRSKKNPISELYFISVCLIHTIKGNSIFLLKTGGMSALVLGFTLYCLTQEINEIHSEIKMKAKI